MFLLSFIFNSQLFFKFNKFFFYFFFSVCWNLIDNFQPIFCIGKLRSSVCSEWNVLWVTSSCWIYLWKSSTCINALVLSSFISHSNNLFLICDKVRITSLDCVKLVRKYTLWKNGTIHSLIIHIVIVNMRINTELICILFGHFETFVQERIIINLFLQCKLS